MWLIIFTIFQTSYANLSLQEEAAYFLSEIKANNPSSQNKLSLRSGLIQIVGNTPGVALNQEDSLPFIGLEYQLRITSFWGIELKTLYGQNILYRPINDDNGNDKFFRTIDIASRFIYEFDPLRKGNYFVLKAGYHQTQNNFELLDPVNNILVQSYSGPSLGVERGLTITSKIHLSASLDLLYILETKDKSDLSIKDNGYALFVKGEFNYLLDFGKNGSQLGLAYWHAAYTNELKPESKITASRQNYVTTYRVLALSYSYLF